MHIVILSNSCRDNVTARLDWAYHCIRPQASGVDETTQYCSLYLSSIDCHLLMLRSVKETNCSRRITTTVESACVNTTKSLSNISTFRHLLKHFCFRHNSCLPYNSTLALASRYTLLLASYTRNLRDHDHAIRRGFDYYSLLG